MAKRAWPAMIERVILREGYSESTGSRLVRHQPAQGPALVRRKAGKRPDMMAVTLFFATYEAYTAFRRWFEDVEEGLAGGLYTVAFPHPVSGAELSVRVVPESDEAAFTAVPWGESSKAWSVGVTLEVMP